jgi:hypothetical protein
MNGEMHSDGPLKETLKRDAPKMRLLATAAAAVGITHIHHMVVLSQSKTSAYDPGPHWVSHFHSGTMTGHVLLLALFWKFGFQTPCGMQYASGGGEVKVKLSLCFYITQHNAMKAYWGMEV